MLCCLSERWSALAVVLLQGVRLQPRSANLTDWSTVCLLPQGKRRFEDYQQGQQQQRGRGRGRQQQQHGAAADQLHEGDVGYQDGDEEMQQVGARGRGRRGGRRVRQRQPQDGDVDMQDAEVCCWLLLYTTCLSFFL